MPIWVDLSFDSVTSTRWTSVNTFVSQIIKTVVHQDAMVRWGTMRFFA
jgi:hypothetical protein